jgi:hypothetical protein
MTDPGLPPPFMEFYYPNLKPNSSLSAVIVSGRHCPPGYRFYKLIRRADTATVIYKRIHEMLSNDKQQLTSF